MKRLLIFLVVVGLVACGTSVANAVNLLSNGYMNALDPAGTWQLGASPTDWIVLADRGGAGMGTYADGMESAPFADHDGGGSGTFFKAFTGNPPWDPAIGKVDADVFQDVPGTPGLKYGLTGWAAAELNYSGLVDPAENSFIAIDFLDAGSLVIGTVSTGLDAAMLAAPARDASIDGPWVWTKFKVSGFAPPGTAFVRSRVSMRDGEFNVDPGQAFIADQFILTESVPEPASLLLGFIGVLGLMGLVRRR